MAPDHDFSERTITLAPDYADETAWTALPNRQDSADVIPVRMRLDAAEKMDIDVFFVHPTTFVSPISWNQPLHDVDTNKTTDASVMRDQASVFNGCCNVYAPRYR